MTKLNKVRGATALQTLTMLFVLGVLLATMGHTQAAGPRNAKEQAAVNVAQADARDTLHMTTFTLVNVSDGGNYRVVDSICTRVVRGVTTRYALQDDRLHRLRRHPERLGDRREGPPGAPPLEHLQHVGRT